MNQLFIKHNQIKFNLLQNAVNKIRLENRNRKINIIDLGVGRANDIHKWNKLNINQVFGIDASQSQLDEAQNRIKNNQTNDTLIQILHIDLSNLDEVNKLFKISNEINIIISFFAVHYFIDNLSIILSKIKMAPDCVILLTFMNLNSAFPPAKLNIIENDLIYIKLVDKNHIAVNYKDSPYFNNNEIIEQTINLHQLTKILNKYFKTLNIKCFLETYPDITIIENNILEIELMHQYIIGNN